jgi:hypothetical protein
VIFFVIASVIDPPVSVAIIQVLGEAGRGGAVAPSQ